MEYSGYVLSAGLEFFFALISIILLIGCLLDHDRKRKTNLIMIVILPLHALMNAIDACVWIWCDIPKLLPIIKIFSFSSYALGCIIISLFSFLLIASIQEYVKLPKWIGKVILSLSALMVLLWFVSLFNGMYYYWDEQGICQLGDWFWLSQAFGIIVFTFDIALVLYYRVHLNHRDTIVLIIYSAIPLLSFLFVPLWDVTPFYTATTIILLLYYIILHVEQGQRVAEQEALLLKQKLELANSQTAIMLSQIRPHFLYNSLTAIAQLCEKNPQKAKEITLNFSEYLRRNMNSLNQKVPLPFADELNHVKNYLAIEQIRFGDALNIVYQINVSDFFIPSLSLQPIIENAVKHGVGMKEEGGTVTITTQETKDCYEIIVSDNGVGFDIETAFSQDREHFGIRLVRIRLQKLVNGTLHIDSHIGLGTTVTISIPKEAPTDNLKS